MAWCFDNDERHYMNHVSKILILAAVCAIFSAYSKAGSPDCGIVPYSFLVIGDTHFDAEQSVYHAAYLAQDKPPKYSVRKKEFNRNADMWRKRMPSMLGNLSAETNVAFAVHVGDLIQGDCNDAEMQRQMLSDALRTIRGNLPNIDGIPLPFLPVVGNHDVRLTGAKGDRSGSDLYRKWSRPLLSEEASRGEFTMETVGEHSAVLRRELGDSTQSCCDLFLLLDYMESDPLSVVSNAFSSISEKQGIRHKFVLCHKPLSKLDPVGHSNPSKGEWLLSSDEVRNKSLKMFCQTLGVLWISGHIHRMAWKKDGGLAEVCVNSVFGKKKQVAYSWKPKNGRGHQYANAAGFVAVLVAEDSVTVAFRDPYGVEKKIIHVHGTNKAQP